MSTLTQAPLHRHGTARLQLLINDGSYALLPGGTRTGPSWQLFAKNGPRAGARYTVRSRPQLSCTCPDHTDRGTVCKHIGALLAARLLTPPGTPRREGRA